MDEKGFQIPEEHKVSLVNREIANIEGVLNVDSFDDQEIILDTDLGLLTLRGEDLHIKQLNLDTGSLTVDGLINSIEYSMEKGGIKDRGKGLLDRLLR